MSLASASSRYNSVVEQQLKQLKSDKNSLTKQKTELTDELKVAREALQEIPVLSEKLGVAQNEVSALQEIGRRMDGHLSSLKLEKENLSNELQLARDQLAEAHKQAEAAAEKQSETQNRLAVLTAEFKGLQDVNAGATNRLADENASLRNRAEMAEARTKELLLQARE